MKQAEQITACAGGGDQGHYRGKVLEEDKEEDDSVAALGLALGDGDQSPVGSVRPQPVDMLSSQG